MRFEELMTIETGTYSKEHLELIYKASQEFSSSLDADEVLTRIMREVIKITGANRGFIMLLDSNGNLDFKTAQGIEKNEIENPAFEVSKSIVYKVANETIPVVTTNAQSDKEYRNQTSIQNLKLRSVLCTPMIVKGETLGVIYVDNKLKNGIFSKADMDLLMAISSNAAIAIKNARLFQEVIEKGRMEKELAQAREVQMSLMPQLAPNYEGWDIAGKWVPAKEVAGDFFDYIDFPDGGLGVVVGDVVDKGMPAALFMAFSRSIIRNESLGSKSIIDIVNRVNISICNESTNGMFLTMVLAKFTPGKNLVELINAGHNPPLHLSVKSGDINKLMPTGMLIGVDESERYSKTQATLEEGDILVLYSDGVPDAINHEGEEFGMDRLQQIIVQSDLDSANLLVNRIWDNMKEFVNGQPRFDDITIVVIRKK